MSETRRVLATTALESTWGKSERLLFLGEWCKKYDRREAWADRAHETLPFHWDDREKLRRDYDYLEGFHHQLLEACTRSLNKLHGVHHPLRYWQILLDPWLMDYVSIVFDRWESLRLAFGSNDDLSVIALGAAPVDPPESWLEFISAVLGDEWNEQLCLAIIRSEYGDRCEVIQAESQSMHGAPSQLFPRAGRLHSQMLRVADLAARALSRRPKVVFIGSYFNLASLLKINLAIGQVPRLFIDEFTEEEGGLDPAMLQPSKRQEFALDCPSETRFEQFLVDALASEIPSSVIERYAALVGRVKRIPMKPRAIVTANFHWSSVVGKTWMAEQSNKGAKLVMLEHGGSFPGRKELFDFEENVSDVRGTWFLPYHSKHVQVPPSKLVGRFRKNPVRRARRTGSAGGSDQSREFCSVIGSECPRWVYRAMFYPMAAQCLASMDLVIRFHDALEDSVRADFRIKPYPDYGWWGTARRYTEIFGREKILPQRRLDSVFARSRLIVCNYPETTFSEAMASGVPTIMLYVDELYERHPVAFPLLDLMRSAGIIFHDPAAAARHVNEIWDDPDAWWSSPAVVTARAEFRRQALDLDGDWVGKWKAFLERVVA